MHINKWKEHIFKSFYTMWFQLYYILEKKQKWIDKHQRRRSGREDETVGWHHWLNEHGFEETPGVGNGQGSLVCCSPCGWKVRTQLSDWTELKHQTNPNWGTVYKILELYCLKLWRPIKTKSEKSIIANKCQKRLVYNLSERSMKNCADLRNLRNKWSM